MNNIYIEIKTTFTSSDEAQLMANLLIDKHLVASAHLSKMHSIYTFNGNKCNQKEIELTCISRSDLWGIIQGFISQNRCREYCPIYCNPIIGISQDYAAWVDKQLGNS